MQFHENPRLIAWWVATFGPVLTLLTPIRRRSLLAVLSLWVCYREIREQVGDTALPVAHDGVAVFLAALAMLALSYLVYRVGAGYARLPRLVRNHPQYCLHGLYWGCLVVLWQIAPGAGLGREVFVAMALIFPYVIWRFGYVLIAGQYGRVALTRFSDQLMAMWPAWGGSNTPYGNGFGYLSRFEAKTNEQLARSQLAGIKLLVLGGILDLLRQAMMALVYGPGTKYTASLGGVTLGIPTLGDLVASDGGTPLLLAWLSVYSELIYQVLRHAVTGHFIIAAVRLAGFNVFRNTYKPLLAESILEFWNRYYFYFKELMSHFFFMPTFTRLGSRLKHYPTLRLFLAVFAAAFVGNMYYHLIKLNEVMVTGDLFGAAYSLRSRAFYCLLLAFGLFVSMYREQGRAGRQLSNQAWRRVLRIAGVWTFFGLIYIWNVKSGASFVSRVEFFLGLWGLR